MGQPALLLADEPTTALDVRLQAQILDLLWQASVERGLGVVLVSHDLGVVAGFAERVLVMYAGRVRESCPCDELFAAPVHPYTKGLLKAIPSVRSYSSQTISPMRGSSPGALSGEVGCAFSPRCPYAEEQCVKVSPPLEEYRAAHRVACHFADEIAAGTRRAAESSGVES
jgi:oligopeptide/dipeptide ABC transporter ATP-binding protein